MDEADRNFQRLIKLMKLVVINTFSHGGSNPSKHGMIEKLKGKKLKWTRLLTARCSVPLESDMEILNNFH